MYQGQSQFDSEGEIADARMNSLLAVGLIAVDVEKLFSGLDYIQWILLLVGVMLLIALVIWFTDNFGGRLENFESLIVPPLEQSNSLPSADDFLEPDASDIHRQPAASGANGFVGGSEGNQQAVLDVEPFPVNLAQALYSSGPATQTIEDRFEEADPFTFEQKEQTAGLETVAETLRDQLSSTETKLEQATLTSKKQETRIEELEKELQSVRNDEMGVLQGQLDERSSALETLRSEMSAASKTAEADRQSLVDELSELRRTTDQSQSQLVASKQQLERLTSESRLTESDLQTVKKEMLTKDQRIGDLESSLAASTKGSQSLQEKLDRTQTELADQRER